MGFFDDIPAPIDPEPEEEPRRPEWFGPPEDWIGGVVALELLVGTSDEAAVYISGLSAYPTGFAFRVHALTRRSTNLGLGVFESAPAGLVLGDEPQHPKSLLRYGLEYPDGRRATSVGNFTQNASSTSLMAGQDEGAAPDRGSELILTPGNGSGTARHSEQECWAWPLPPQQGAVRFVCEWLRFDVPESEVRIDASSVRDAALRAVAVWGGPTAAFCERSLDHGRAVR